MEEPIVKFETAKLAYAKGFDWDCYQAYNSKGEPELAFDFTGELKFTKEDIKCSWENDYPAYLAPTQSQLQKWLREFRSTIVNIYFHSYHNHKGKVNCYVLDKYGVTKFNKYYEDHEIGFEEGLFDALNLLPNFSMTELPDGSYYVKNGDRENFMSGFQPIEKK